MPSKRQGGMAGQPRLVPASEVAPPESESHHDEAGFGGGGDGVAVQAVPRKPGPQTAGAGAGRAGVVRDREQPVREGDNPQSETPSSR
ncbi:hypothetical protein DIPPA_24439 [Diplonema papillatum]|nr:hypothetical protein DIPPA_24439 [Diplonema papillatum]